MNGLKIAFSHDWLNGMRGGEKCLEALCELYPGSAIYTLFHEKGRISPRIAGHPIFSSYLERFPSVFKNYRYYLPFYSGAIGSLKVKKHDLVLSLSHCVAKGIRKDKKIPHICYCFTPARYAWGFFDEYFGGMNWAMRWLVSLSLKAFRKWDLKTNAQVDHFVAISEHVKGRIKRYYGRDAEVIYPPVDTVYYTPDTRTEREDFYLVVSALVPYKKIALAVRAFNRLGKKLVVIGEGPEQTKLKRLAKSNVRFLSWQPEEILKDYYRRARALIFPGEEDFGIVPVEAQACGCPVIAFARGGALETVLENESGIFFKEQKEQALADAVLRFERSTLDPEAARRNAERFSKQRFQMEMKSMIQRRGRA